MFPQLFQSSDGSWSIASYSVLLICAWLCAAWYVRVSCKRRELIHPRLPALFWVAALCSWFGARLLWLAFHPQALSKWSSIFVWDAGQSSAWAGLCLFVIASVLGCIRYRISVSLWLDRIGPAWLITRVFERFGAFLSGGDFGLVTHLPWGVRFSENSPAAQFHRHEMIAAVAPEQVSLVVHPVQLYGAFMMIGVALIAGKLETRSPQPGMIFKISILGYAASRLLVEDPFKIHRSSDVMGPISADQFTAMAVIAAVGLAFRFRHRGQTQRGKDSSVSDRKLRARKKRLR